MKMSRNLLRILIMVAGILVLVIVIMYVKPSLDEQRTILETTNRQLTEKLSEIQQLEDNLASYRTQTVEFEEENEKILSSFPAEVRIEDAILYAKELAEKMDMEITTVGGTTGTLLYSMQEVGMDAAAETTSEDAELASDTSADSGQETAADATSTQSADDDLGIITSAMVEKPNYNLYDMMISYDFKVDYNNLKKVFKAVLGDDNKKNISSISLVYDTESGILTGNLSLNMYFVTGTEKVYESPSLGSGKVKKGKANLFGTITTSSDDDSASENDESSSGNNSVNSGTSNSTSSNSGSTSSSANSSSGSSSGNSSGGGSSTKIGTSEVQKD